MCYCTSGYLMRENSACTQKHFPFQSAIPVKVHTNMEQHIEYTDPEKKKNVSLHTLQPLGISNHSGDKKKEHTKKLPKRLALGKETDHLCPAFSQHCPEAAPFPWRMLCNIRKSSSLLFEGRAVQSACTQWFPFPCNFYNCLSAEKDQCNDPGL